MKKSEKKQTVLRNVLFLTAILLFVLAGSLSFWLFNSKETNNKNTINETEEVKAKEELVIPIVFGQSTEGKEIKGYVIGNGEKTFLFFGAIHGNEMATNDLLERLVIEIKQNPKIISDNIRLVVIPMLNPDGYYDRIDKLNANEVNLNLNFETTEWKNYGPEQGQWAGNEPFSEIESKVLKEVVEKYTPSIMISYHAKGAISIPEESSASKQLAQWYAGKTGYVYDDTADFFGTATRWFEEKTGSPAISVELTDYYISDWQINKPALIELLSGNYSQ